MQDGLVGTWTLSKDKSEFDVSHRPAAATLVFELDAQGAYLMKAEGVKENGERVVERPQTFVVDGQEHEVPGFSGLRMVCARLDAATVRAEVKREDGSLAGGGTYTLSPDGRTLTVTNFGYDSQLREFHQRTVWERP